eukprot:CAMPEP_0181221012 /NCGR_PEP_ID=MMETSP1096-20121128/29155_1 /TAXON_ID=156174 ORGANISM="Chrysochromulina ericina, Strain CCMP281" /NCGR_SAMPLE_ID=MMETSP1096 /ASSEMBLY_ACC=CAM_ASM_000453 /LENGTH=30 /DNA_ID= /DNA_START= /DNA_END= /DNA_ORIENTATION=
MKCHRHRTEEAALNRPNRDAGLPPPPAPPA